MCPLRRLCSHGGVVVMQVANSVPSEEAVLSLRCCGDAGG